MKYKLIANYVEFSEMFAAVTNIAHLLLLTKVTVLFKWREILQGFFLFIICIWN